MTKRNWWRAGFLTVTALALVMELVAGFDGRADTDPWTDLVVRYVPWEAALAVFGALLVWVPIHFYTRYRKRRQP